MRLCQRLATHSSSCTNSKYPLEAVVALLQVGAFDQTGPAEVVPNENAHIVGASGQQQGRSKTLPVERQI